MSDKDFPAYLNKIMRCKCFDNAFDIIHQEGFQLVITDVACGNQRQFVRLLRNEERIYEVCVFRYDHSLFFK